MRRKGIGGCFNLKVDVYISLGIIVWPATVVVPGNLAENDSGISGRAGAGFIVEL